MPSFSRFITEPVKGVGGKIVEPTRGVGGGRAGPKLPPQAPIPLPPIVNEFDNPLFSDPGLGGEGGNFIPPKFAEPAPMPMPAPAPAPSGDFQSNVDFMNQMATANAQVGSDGQAVMPSFSYDPETNQYVRDSSAFGLTGDAALTRYSPEEFQQEFGRTLAKKGDSTPAPMPQPMPMPQPVPIQGPPPVVISDPAPVPPKPAPAPMPAPYDDSNIYNPRVPGDILPGGPGGILPGAPIPMPQPVPQPVPVPAPQPIPQPVPQPMPMPVPPKPPVPAPYDDSGNPPRGPRNPREPVPVPIPQPIPEPIPAPMPAPQPVQVSPPYDTSTPAPLPPQPTGGGLPPMPAPYDDSGNPMPRGGRRGEGSPTLPPAPPTLPPAPQPVQVSPTYDTSTPAPLPPQPSEGLNIPGIGSISPEILAQIQAGIGGESVDFKGIGSLVPTEPPVQVPPTVDPSLYSDPELGTGPRPTGGGRRGEGEPSGIETMAEGVGMGDYMEPSIPLPDGNNFDLSTLDFSGVDFSNIGGGFNLGNFSPNLGLGDTEANGSGMPNVGAPSFTPEDDPSLYSDPEMSVGGPRGGPQGGPGMGNGPGFTMGGTDASGNGNGPGGPGFGDNAGGGSGPGTPDPSNGNSGTSDPSNPYPFIPDSLDISGMDDTMLNGLNGFYEQFPNGIMPGGFNGLGNIDFSGVDFSNLPGGTNDGSYTVDSVGTVGDLPGGPGGGVPPNDGVDNGEDPPDVPPPPPSVYTPPNVRSASTFGLVGAQPTLPTYLQGANPFARPETQAGIGSLAGGG